MSPTLAVVLVVAIVLAVVLGIAGFHLTTGLLRVGFDGGAPGFWAAALREVPAFLRIGWWGLSARRRWGVEDVDAGEEVVVVLVHGAMADGSCCTGWRRALVKAGVKAPILAPDHGLVVRPLEVHAARTRAFVDALLERAPAVKLVFVGHSMGGLIIRRILADDEGIRAATLGAITVASPHQGTESIRGVPFVPHLRFREGGYEDLPRLSELVKKSFVVGSAVDAIVYPAHSCYPEGSEAICFDDVGHAAFLVREDVAQRVASLVQELVASTAARDSVTEAA